MISKLRNSAIGLILAVWMLMVLLPGAARAQGTLMQLPPLTDSLGHPIAGATIAVFTTSGSLATGLTCVTPVTVYKDVGLTVPFTTLTTDGNGNFPFFISPSVNPYGFTVSGAGTSTSQCYGFSAPVPPMSSPTFTTITTTSGPNVFGGSINAGSNSLTAGAATLTSLDGIGLATSSTIQSIINSACTGSAPAIAWMPLGSTGVPALTVPNSSCAIACPTKRGCTLKLANGANTDFITVNGKSNVVITGVILDGNSSNQTTGNCVHATGVTNVHVDDNEIENCHGHAVFYDGTSDVVSADDNFIHDTVSGSGILAGNTPLSQGGSNTQVTNCHFNRNTIKNIHGSADGIFLIGNLGSGYGTGKCEVNDNVIGPNIDDTGIEIGVASHDIVASNNAIDATGGLAGSVGLSVRSASNVVANGNKIKGDPTVASQVCLLFWNNAGNDATTALNINAASNIALGCTGTSAFDVQVNLANAGTAGVGNHMRLIGTLTDGGSGHYNYLGFPNNFYECGNDDGGFCRSNEGGDFTIEPGSGNVVHFFRAIGISPSGSSFTPTSSIHVQSGGSLSEIAAEATGAANEGYTVKNTLQQWSWGVRNDLSQNWTLRDITHGADVLQIAPTSGNATFIGTVTGTRLISNIATGTAPLAITSTTPVANLAATPTTYNAAGTQQTNVHVVIDTCTLGTNCGVTLSGSAAYTNSTSYTCNAEDQTAAAATRVQQTSGSAFTITGTGTDVIRYTCVGS